MKILIITIFTLLSTISYSQINWGIYDNSEPTKLRLISRINKSMGNKEGTLPIENSRSSLLNYNVFDITEDGLLDIVYTGPYSEGSAVILFENKVDSFVRSDFIPGVLMGINRLPLSRTIEIKTHLYPCCAGETHSLYTVIVNPSNNGLEIITIDEQVFIEGTQEYYDEIKPIVFETVNPEYKLRSTPQIQTDVYIWMNRIDDSNTVAIYPPGSRGTAIGSSTDETGRVWWYVIMENNLQPIKSLSYIKGSKSLGWMSSRYVKQVE